ncbi:MAG: DNA-processing protein DprA [Ruminiclostridium sp.]
MEKYYLWLVMAFGGANPEVTELLCRFETAEKVYAAFKGNYSAAGPVLTEKAALVTLEQAEKRLYSLSKEGISLVTPESGCYPERLKGRENPPYLLFVRGNPKLLKGKLLSASGSRRISAACYNSQSRICENLCKKYTFVTTLSEGSDQLTCITAIKQNRPCIEVLPCGLYHRYPEGSFVLREELLRSGGCVISEYLPETPVKRSAFRRRAKLIGEISPAIIVFQAGTSSGAITTAENSDFPFFLPPADVFSSAYAGSVTAARNGAALYFGEEDLEAAYSEKAAVHKMKAAEKAKSAAEKAKTPAQRKAYTPAEPPKATEKPQEAEKLTKAQETEKLSEAQKPQKPQKTQKTEEPPKPQENIVFSTPAHKQVYNTIIEYGKPATFDTILNRTDADITELYEILLDLELEGFIEAMPGNRYGIIEK